jgi:4-hydroxy-tetrahydrodipicolinate reductase
MVRIGIAGIGGRMGREVLAAAEADPSVQIVGGIERREHVAIRAAELGARIAVRGTAAELIPSIDVLIDFTSPDNTMMLASACAESGTRLVSGTTGLSSGQLAELQALAENTAIFYSRNMSVGINALLAALPELVKALDGYDIEIVEAHHRHKADAPSGTALAIAEVIAAAIELPLERHAVYGRYGVAARQPGDIGIHAVRGGGNSGEHTVVIADEGEEIRVSHRAYSRQTFALGALRAAHFLASQSAGFYTMVDLLRSGH